MKIEMVVPSLARAGMEVVVARLVEGLSRRGHDVGVTCILAKGAVAEDLESAGHRVTLVEAPGLLTNLVPLRLARWLARCAPDVVHVHSGAWPKGARAAILAHVPRVVCTVHGIDGTVAWYEPLLERWAAHHTTVTVAVTDALLPYLAGRVGINRDRLHVVTNGVDTTRYRPGARTGMIRQRFGLGADDVVIGHVARFTPVKNHTMILEAMELVLRQRPRTFLALAGDGPLRGEIERRVDALGMGAHVGFLGQVSDLPDVYRDMDLLVLTSLSEATPMSVLEGMATGLPVVATAVGGLPDLLASGQTGILVGPGDVNSFAHAIVAIANAPEERARLGREARKRALDHYSEDRMIDDYEALYAGERNSA